MGKKSREKRKRRQVHNQGASASLIESLLKAHGMSKRSNELEDEFQRRISAVEAVLNAYDPLDAALAIAVSDLWLENVAGPIKHIFAWAVLTRIEPSAVATQRIVSYEDFKTFAETLYATWPEFPSLEDFIPEADWGQVRARLGNEFVPMFYGSSIERTPDFVEAFRITQASNEAALADMDLAIALQSHVLRSMPELAQRPLPDLGLGHIKVPPEDFWFRCRQVLLSAETELVEWRARSSGRLEARFGTVKTPLSRDGFGDSCMQGRTLPFIGLQFPNHWIPIGIRNAPSNVIEAWADEQQCSSTDFATHRRLAWFIRERFQRVFPGPLAITIGNREFSLPISCVLSPNSKIYLLVACKHTELAARGRVAQEIYSALKQSKAWHLKFPNGQPICITNADGQYPSAQEVEILLVPTQESTAMGFVDSPKPPIRLMFLADLITIFDSVEDLDELDRFWICLLYTSDAADE